MSFSQRLISDAPHADAAGARSDNKAAPTRAGRASGVRVGGGMLVLMGAMLWLAGARYTLVGWHTGINWFAAWLGLPAQIPAIVGYWTLLAIPIGLAYSVVELRRPWQARARDWNATVLYWTVWLLIVVTDGGSTYLGVRQPGPSALAAAQQIAAAPALAAVWAMVLTFVPEWFIVGGTRLLKR